MKLRKVISGGQTGADQTGIICARELGLETGGTAPKNYRTEKGSERWLAEYGLVEHPSYDFGPRTRQNVLDGDITLWFGNIGSPGYWCTSRACEQYGKQLYVNPDAETIRTLADAYGIWNVAGNRASKNNEVIAITREAFKALNKG